MFFEIHLLMQKCQNPCSFTGSLVEMTAAYTLAKDEDGIFKKSAKYTLGTAAHLAESLIALIELVATGLLYGAAKSVQLFLPKATSEWFKEKIVEPLYQRNLNTALGMLKVASRTMTNFISDKSREKIENRIDAMIIGEETRRKRLPNQEYLKKPLALSNLIDSASEATITPLAVVEQQAAQYMDQPIDWCKFAVIASSLVLVAATACLIYKGYGQYVVEKSPSESNGSLALVPLRDPKIEQCLWFASKSLELPSPRPPVFSNMTLALGQCLSLPPKPVEFSSLHPAVSSNKTLALGQFLSLPPKSVEFSSLHPPVSSNKTLALGQISLPVAEVVEHGSIIFSSAVKNLFLLGLFSTGLGMRYSSRNKVKIPPKKKEDSHRLVFSPVAIIGFLSPNQKLKPFGSPEDTIAKRVKNGGRLRGRKSKKPCIACDGHEHKERTTNCLKNHPIKELLARAN